MVWKLWSLQGLLDTLFDDGWCSLGTHDASDAAALPLIDLT
jgi:hypothetical protein